MGYRLPFISRHHLSPVPLPLPSYSSTPFGVLLSLLRSKDAIEPASTDPGFYIWLFVTLKVSSGWCPVIDLSRLNRFVRLFRFRMETSAYVLQSLRPGDWVVSLDLLDAYLQVPVHLDSRRFLRFCVGSEVFQLKALCFGLSSAPQSLPGLWLRSPPLCIGLGSGSSAAWTTGSSSDPRSRRSRGEGLPSLALRPVEYSGQPLQEYPHTVSADRLSQHGTPVKPFEGFPDTSSCPVSARARLRIWVLSAAAAGSLAFSSGGHVISLHDFPRLQAPHAVPPTPLAGCGSSSFRDVLISWDGFGGGPSPLIWRWGFLSTFLIRTSSCIRTPRTPGGVPLSALNTCLACAPSFYSLFDKPPETSGYLLRGRWFPSASSSSVSGSFHDNSTALSYLRKEGRMRSTTLNSVAQAILCLCEANSIRLLPQFIPGKLNVLPDALRSSFVCGQ